MYKFVCAVIVFCLFVSTGSFAKGVSLEDSPLLGAKWENEESGSVTYKVLYVPKIYYDMLEREKRDISDPFMVTIDATFKGHNQYSPFKLYKINPVVDVTRRVFELNKSILRPERCSLERAVTGEDVFFVAPDQSFEWRVPLTGEFVSRNKKADCLEFGLIVKDSYNDETAAKIVLRVKRMKSTLKRTVVHTQNGVNDSFELNLDFFSNVPYSIVNSNGMSVGHDSVDEKKYIVYFNQNKEGDYVASASLSPETKLNFSKWQLKEDIYNVFYSIKSSSDELLVNKAIQLSRNETRSPSINRKDEEGSGKTPAAISKPDYTNHVDVGMCEAFNSKIVPRLNACVTNGRMYIKIKSGQSLSYVSGKLAKKYPASYRSIFDAVIDENYEFNVEFTDQVVSRDKKKSKDDVLVGDRYFYCNGVKPGLIISVSLNALNKQ